MPNVGPAEILVILVVALLVFGPDKLPEIGRQLGRATREFRRMQASLRDEVREVLEPPVERARPPTLPAPQPTEPGEPSDADPTGAEQATDAASPAPAAPDVPAVEADRTDPSA